MVPVDHGAAPEQVPDARQVADAERGVLALDRPARDRAAALLTDDGGRQNTRHYTFGCHRSTRGPRECRPSLHRGQRQKSHVLLNTYLLLPRPMRSVARKRPRAVRPMTALAIRGRGSWSTL